MSDEEIKLLLEKLRKQALREARAYLRAVSEATQEALDDFNKETFVTAKVEREARTRIREALSKR